VLAAGALGVLGIGAGAGFGGRLVGTCLGAPLGVALKAPRTALARGSVRVVVFNLAFDVNIRPAKSNIFSACWHSNATEPAS